MSKVNFLWVTHENFAIPNKGKLISRHCRELLAESNFAIAPDAPFTESEKKEIAEYRVKLWAIWLDAKSGKGKPDDVILPELPKCLE